MTICNIVRVLFLTLPLAALLPYMGDCRHFRPVWSRTSKRLVEPESEIYSPYEMAEDGFKRRFEGLSENELEMAREIEDKLERAQQRQQEEEDEEEETVRKRNYWDDEEDEDEDEYEYDLERPLEAEDEEEGEEKGNKKKRMLGNWNQMKHYPHRLHTN